MSWIDDLITEHCPGGVEFKSLGEVGAWYGGGTPSKGRADFWAGGTIPWLSPKDMRRPVVSDTQDHITEAAVQGSATKLVPANSVAIVVRSSILDRILPTALVPVPMTLNQDMKAVVPSEGVLPGYLAHLLQAIGPELLRAVRKTGGSVASLEYPKLLAQRIPVPHVAVQKAVVELLDKLTRLQAEIESKLLAEIEMRSRQYAYYRDSLLSFDAVDSPSRRPIRWARMSEVGEFFRGRRFTKGDVVPDGVPSIHYGEIYTYYGVVTREARSRVRSEMKSDLRFASKNDVVIAAVGETVEDVAKAVAWLGDEDVAIHDDTFAFRHSMNPKFVAYYLQTSRFHVEKNKHVARAKLKRISSEGLGRISIPVPEREDQDRIVALLDKFDDLVCNLSAGLLAEIVAYRKQHVYYRDRLLAFREAG